MGTAAAPPLPVEPPPMNDWHEEIRYDVLLHFPEVRDLIAHHAGMAKKSMTGEQFLEICETLMQSVAPGSLKAAVSIALPITTRLGIKTGKNRTELLPNPTGKVIVGTLCSLARHGWEMVKVHQDPNGCVLEAKLPSDIWSLAGELVVSVQRCELGTTVEAAAKIPGQLYDWGKCKKCLDELFADLPALADHPVLPVRKAG
jgi:hypothetical protein